MIDKNHTIDTLLTNIIDRECSDKNVALLLSGGVDSTSLGFAAHRLGKKVNAYTFHIENQPSYDSQKAIETSLAMGWNICDISIPVDNIERDFIILSEKYDCIKKTHFECTFPFLYVYPEIKESIVLSGVAADGHYGVSKKACIHYKEPKSLFDKFRENYFSHKNPAGIIQQKKLAENYNIKLIAPYVDELVINWFRQFDWYELNKPFQKHHVRNSFKEFSNIKIKNHINLQLGAGIDKIFEHKVLNNKNLNYRNRTRVLDVCRDWSVSKNTTLFDYIDVNEKKSVD